MDSFRKLHLENDQSVIVNINQILYIEEINQEVTQIYFNEGSKPLVVKGHITYVLNVLESK